ncbi:ROK family transcriptional regulator [Rhodoferax saidenbachensis]|uniref:NBD/HSP70 family sugar kinase n=1 Tax=Rhodoferax saidenbachensis TaxID=1484693 RepID=A0ABU1ZJN6_9BURK|nr:ROK family transcriptional regulator [Rhodoferax saidenbachensis]MDR7305759.1 putative NBD/HSP70 family sugar kinase [Rhodoferax saidenbachensis]
MKTTGDQQLVKRINRSVLLRLLRSQGGLSRAQLANESGLTKSTVSLLVRELIDEGWLTENDVTAAQGLGRPSTPLQIDGRTRGMIGVEVAVEALRVVGVSLTGQVLCALEEPLTGTQVEDVCRQVARLVARTRTQLKRRSVQLSGVGVGLPGAFDEATGMLRFAPNLGWRNVDFVPLITKALAQAGMPPVPVHVQNEADTAALSEYEFSEGDAKDSLIFVTCGAGVGAGIVLNDRLFTGIQGMAGEIGHSILQIDGPLCSCGRKGCAETFFGARTLSKLKQPAQGGHYLGVVLQNLWTTFNPSALVVGGPSCEQYPGIVEVAKATLQSYAASAGMAAPAVRTARYGLLASAVGAAALVLHHDLRPMHTRSPASVAQPSDATDPISSTTTETA